MFPTSYARVLDGFLEFLILGVDEIDPSQFFVRFQDGALLQTTFASLSAWCALPLMSRVLAMDDLTWM